MQEHDRQAPTPEIDHKYTRRRDLVANWGGIFDRVLPTAVTDSGDNLERAEELLKEGRGLVVIINHPTSGDHLRAAKTVFASEAIKKSPISAAVAHHQFPWGLERAIDLLGIDTTGVVTASTVRKGKNTLHPTQKAAAILEHVRTQRPDSDRPPFRTVWEKLQRPLQEGHGLRDYARSAAATLNEGGVVFLGPQGTRSKELVMWDKRPVQLILSGVDKKKQLGMLFVGIDERGGGDGINFGHTYGINIGSAMPYEDLQSFALGKHMTIDQAVFTKLSEAVNRPQSQ